MPSRFGSHVMVTIHRTEWLSYGDVRVAFHLLPSLDAQAGMLAAVAHTQVHLSLSLFLSLVIFLTSNMMQSPVTWTSLKFPLSLWT